MNGYQFDKYQLRPVEEADRGQLEQCIAFDPCHRETVKPEFFLAPQVGEESFVLLDEAKAPLFYVKQERALRVHIQFGLSDTAEARAKNKEALRQGLIWLAQRARAAGFRQLIFESNFAPLIKFCVDELGFTQSKDELIRNIGLANAAEKSST